MTKGRAMEGVTPEKEKRTDGSPATLQAAIQHTEQASISERP